MISEYAAPTGLGIFLMAVSTKMSLLTELKNQSFSAILYHLLEVLGKDKVMQRIEKALVTM